jgi:hypothetical protein
MRHALYWKSKIRIRLKGDADKEIIISRDRAQDFKTWWAG